MSNMYWKEDKLRGCLSCLTCTGKEDKLRGCLSCLTCTGRKIS